MNTLNRNDTSVPAFLLNRKETSQVALRTLDQDYTYDDLRGASEEVSKYLLQRGRSKGDRVLLIADNSFFWVGAYLGILRAGMICVPLPINSSINDLAYIIRSTGAEIAFVQARFAMTRKEVLKPLFLVTDSEIPDHDNSCSFQRARAEVRAVGNGLSGCGPCDVAALMFTSGSTGKPRGVVVTHANIIANTKSIVQYLGLTQADRIMTVLPFHYCFGTSLLHTHLSVGATLVIDPRFMYPEKVLDRMQVTQCTGFAGVPSHFQILLRKSTLDRRKFPHLRYVQQAGGHLAPSFIRELRKALPNTQIFVMYGQTEATARLSYVPPVDLDRKLGSIGKAVPGVTLKVIDECEREIQPGETGQIVAEGANIAQGYWNDPEESAKYFRDGRLYTGDLATIDKEGFIYILDRAKDFLKCGGKRVGCRQIEEKLLEFDELLEAAVVGISDEILGEAVRAYVVPRKSESVGLQDRVLLFCKENLSHQLVPKDVIVMKSLPKNSAGKIMKSDLRNILA